MMIDEKKFEELFSNITTFKQNPYHPLVWIVGNPKIGVPGQEGLAPNGQIHPRTLPPAQPVLGPLGNVPPRKILLRFGLTLSFPPLPYPCVHPKPELP